MISAVGFRPRPRPIPPFLPAPDRGAGDRRLNRGEKLAILEAWELEARELAVASEENMTGGEPSLLEEVVQA